MHTTRSSSRLSFVLFAVASLLATSLTAAIVWGPSLLVLVALVGSAVLLAGAHAAREAIREWRWNAGHRLH